MHVAPVPPHAPAIDPHQYATDDEGGSPHEYSPTSDRHYTHARPPQHHDYNQSQFPPAPPQAMNHRHTVTHPHQYSYYVPPKPPVPPIPPRDPFQEPRSQGYYGGYGGTGRFYHQRERVETPRTEKHVRRWSPPAVAAPEPAHTGALRRNDSIRSASSTRGHGREKERKKVGERSENIHDKKSSRTVEKGSGSAIGAREKGNPLRELEQLRFTPKITAGTHMRRFERLVSMVYPGVSSSGKWNMFVKTLNYPGLWGAGSRTTPGKWAAELKKTESMSFDHLKTLFIERWGTREEREQIQSSIERKKEKDRERQEKNHQYLHQQLISTADSLPKASPMLPHLVIHHDERPMQHETNTPEGGDIIVTISDDKRRRVKDRTRERHGEGGEGWGQKLERERDRRSTQSRSRTASTAPKTTSNPCSQRAASLSPLPPSPPPSQNEGAWEPEGQSWGTEQGHGNSAQDSPQKGECASRGTDHGEWSQGKNSGNGNEDNWDSPQKEEWASGGTDHGEWSQGKNSGNGNEDNWDSLELSSPQPVSPPADEWSVGATPKSPGHTEGVLPEWNSAAKAASPDKTALSETVAPTPPESTPSVESNASLSLRPRLLEGKIAAITGASRGIGRAIALGFAREGAHIIAHYWGTVSDPSNDDIVSLATEIRGMGQRCEVVFGDISDPDISHKIVQKAVEEFGRLDIGVGNAGMCWFRDFWDITPELMRRHVDVNLNGNMWFVQACARQMKAQYVTATKTALDEDNWAGDGDFQDIPDHSLLLVSSTTSMTASPAAAHYAASSAGIVSLVQSMAVELGKYGIRCNALLPGTVMTRMVKEGVENVDIRRGMERRVPLLGRLGRPRDVVGPAIFLVGEQSRYVTGAKLAVDGGASAGGGGGW